MIQKGRFERILDPGNYWVWAPGLEELKYSMREGVFASPWADYLAKEGRELAEQYFTIVETTDLE